MWLALALVLLSGGFIVTAARQEFLTRGTQRLSGLTIADYRAKARVDNRPAPPFEFPALDGNGTIALQYFSGKVIVLNFWASWCGPCRAEAPSLQRLWEEYRKQGVQFLGVNYRDDRFAARAYEEEFGITYPSVFDPAGKLAFDYQLVGLPSTFLIGRNGQIAFHFTGIVTETLLQQALGEVLRAEGS